MFITIGWQQGARKGYSASWPGSPPGPAGMAAYQYGFGVGSTNELGGGTCGLLIPNGKRLVSVAGSITNKQPYPANELLLRIVAGMGDGVNYSTLYQMENFQETFELDAVPLWLDTEDPNLQSEVGASWRRGAWVEWQDINNGAGDVGFGGAFEYQLTFILKSIGA